MEGVTQLANRATKKEEKSMPTQEPSASRPPNAQMSTDATAPERRAPRWLRLLNSINRPLLRRGIGPTPQHLLCVPGRKSGVIRSTPVAVFKSGGDRYIAAGYAGSDWVKNARTSGGAYLERGRHRERVVLEEVAEDERPPILRDFAVHVRGGRSFLTVRSDATDKDFAAASPRHPVFRLLSDGAR